MSETIVVGVAPFIIIILHNLHLVKTHKEFKTDLTVCFLIELKSM